jgi:hypothetical protein
MRARAVLLAPFSLLWTTVKALFWPAVIVALAWWWLPDSWARGVSFVVGCYLVLAFLVARAAWRRKSARNAFDVIWGKKGKYRA